MRATVGHWLWVIEHSGISEISELLACLSKFNGKFTLLFSMVAIPRPPESVSARSSMAEPEYHTYMHVTAHNTPRPSPRPASGPRIGSPGLRQPPTTHLLSTPPPPPIPKNEEEEEKNQLNCPSQLNQSKSSGPLIAACSICN